MNRLIRRIGAVVGILCAVAIPLRAEPLPQAFPDLAGHYTNCRFLGGLLSVVAPPPTSIKVEQTFGGVIDAVVTFPAGSTFPEIRNTIIADGKFRQLYDFEFGVVVQAYRKASFMNGVLQVEQIDVLPDGRLTVKASSFEKIDANRLRFTASVFGILLIDVVGELASETEPVGQRPNLRPRARR